MIHTFAPAAPSPSTAPNSGANAPGVAGQGSGQGGGFTAAPLQSTDGSTQGQTDAGDGSGQTDSFSAILVAESAAAGGAPPKAPVAKPLVSATAAPKPGAGDAAGATAANGSLQLTAVGLAVQTQSEASSVLSGAAGAKSGAPGDKAKPSATDGATLTPSLWTGLPAPQATAAATPTPSSPTAVDPLSGAGRQVSPTASLAATAAQVAADAGTAAADAKSQSAPVPGSGRSSAELAAAQTLAGQAQPSRASQPPSGQAATPTPAPVLTPGAPTPPGGQTSDIRQLPTRAGDPTPPAGDASAQSGPTVDPSAPRPMSVAETAAAAQSQAQSLASPLASPLSSPLGSPNKPSGSLAKPGSGATTAIASVTASTGASAAGPFRSAMAAAGGGSGGGNDAAAAGSGSSGAADPFGAVALNTDAPTYAQQDAGDLAQAAGVQGQANPTSTDPTSAGAQTVARLAVQIAQTAQGPASQFNLTLHPAELGGVQVKVQVDRTGAVSAVLTFDNPQAAADLSARADDLKTALNQAGFNVSDSGLSFNLSGQSQGQAGGGQADPGAFGGRAFRAAAAGADDLLTAVNEAASRLQTPSASSGLDIRI